MSSSSLIQNSNQGKLLVVGAASTALLATSIYLLSSKRSSLIPFHSSSTSQSSKSASLTSELSRRSPLAFTSLLSAFGPDGANCPPGTSPGAMTASPSGPGLVGGKGRLDKKNENENYQFQWSRDGGICLRMVIRKFMQAELGQETGQNNETSQAIEKIIKDFVSMNLQIQHTENPSGSFSTGGIGEPKLLLNGKPFEESWGRPQNDGPALRAIALLTYANHILSTRAPSSESTSYVLDVVYGRGKNPSESASLIKNDLNYVAREWNKNTFDLWEEVQAAQSTGGHFYALSCQMTTLRSGAEFVFKHEITSDYHEAEEWKKTAGEIEKHLEKFWNAEGSLEREEGPAEPGVDWNDGRVLGSIPKEQLQRPHILPTLSRVGGQNKPTQVDTATLLALTHGWNGKLGVKEDDTWKPWGERSLASLDRIAEVFSGVYKVNNARKVEDGVLAGRYPEDIYDGVVTSIGHPWFICTHVIAEVLYLSYHHFSKLGEIRVTPINFPLFKRFIDVQGTQTLFKGDIKYEKALKGLRRMADGYLRTAGEYVGKDGRMDEQIERNKGTQRGARELSWSYASLLSAIEAREGHEAPLA